MENELAKAVSHLVLQLAVILFVAKVAGEITERYLKQSPVLGELAAGMIIGPYTLGRIPLPVVGPLFPLPTQAHSAIPISPELYAIGQIAAVVLLFMAGLETDFSQFFRFAAGAALVAAGGIIFPFMFGSLATVALGFADSFLDPKALFMGAILTATSVGITARVLGDIGKLDTAEGLTILGGAVIDDVLGILVLTIVVSLGVSGAVDTLQIGIIGAKALGFWLILTAVVALVATSLSRFFLSFRAEGAGVALALAIALFGAFLAESFGLAMIIGAYSVGLALSRTRAAQILEHPLRSIYHFLVPVFFAVMGMLVDFGAMGGVLVFGLVITLLAIVSKVAGCGLPSLAVGFNKIGSLRIGIGMLPRGEVALIVAGVGLTSGIIGTDIFGVAIMMTIITTILAPILLVPSFRWGGSGRRKAVVDTTTRGAAVVPVDTNGEKFEIKLDHALATIFHRHLEQVLLREGFTQLGGIRRVEGPDVTEFQRGEELLVVYSKMVENELRHIVIEYQTSDWDRLLTETVKAATTEATLALLESLPEQGRQAREEVIARLAEASNGS